jgi:hypothetical protein
MKQMNAIKNLPGFFLFIVAAAILFSTGFAGAMEQPLPDRDVLREIYRRNISELENDSFGFPLFLESMEQGDKVTVDVYGVFDYPFNRVADVAKTPANWCEILFLHPNVKAGTYRSLQGKWLLTFYAGRKVYQAPEDTHPIVYHFRIVEQGPDYLNVLFTADTGPLGTKDHLIRFEVMPLDGGRAFAHVRYAYSRGVVFRFAEKLYFRTLGRNKVGFTMTRTGNDGKSAYIGGARGALERNAVRYYFAFQSFMDTLHFPKESRFRMRIGNWYDLTNRYRKQLYEMDKEDYLKVKTKEYKNQQMLQLQIKTGPSMP